LCHLAVANMSAERAAAAVGGGGGGGAAAAAAPKRAESLTDEEWLEFLESCIVANNIRIKALFDATSKAPRDALAKHFRSLGYGSAEPVPVEVAKEVVAERQRRLNFERTILETYDGGRANTHGYGEAALARAWEFAPLRVRDAGLFATAVASKNMCVLRARPLRFACPATSAPHANFTRPPPPPSAPPLNTGKPSKTRLRTLLLACTRPTGT
jgi:hypothetical protein